MKYFSLIVIIASLMGCYGIESEKTGFEGKSIPTFKILLKDSVTYFDVGKIQPGKPVVLFYYGSYCPYSRGQMQEIMDNMSVMKNIQFVLITRGSLNEMKIFCSHYGIDKYKNIIAGVDFKNFLGEYFKITGVPFTAVYNKEIKLLSAFPGRIFVKQIISTINQ